MVCSDFGTSSAAHVEGFRLWQKAPAETRSCFVLRLRSRGGYLEPLGRAIRVFGAGSGYELCQPESDARVGCDRGRARTSVGDPLRQRAGADEPGHKWRLAVSIGSDT